MEYLLRVQAGQDMALTSRERPIVRIIGIAEATGTARKAGVFARLRALPWVREGKGQRLKSVGQVISAGEPLLSELLLKARD